MNRSDIHLKNTIYCLVVERGRAACEGLRSPKPVVTSKGQLKNCTGWVIPSVKKQKKKVYTCTYLVK